MNIKTAIHYDALIDEGNDPVLDPPALRAYMDKWDGETFFSLMELDPSCSVLEIGCGTGRLSLKAAPLVSRFVGIDLSSKTVARAAEHLNEYSPVLICGDFLSHDFDESFDVIYSSLTTMHVEDKRAFMSKVCYLLKEGGRFVLSISKSKDTVLDYGIRKLQLYPDDKDTTVNLLYEFGFKDIAVHETEFAHIIKAVR